VVCPVCVVGGIGFILSRIFGFPDVVVSFITGMLATSTAYWMNHHHGKKMEEQKRAPCGTQYYFRYCVFVFSQMDRIVVE
jgi:hypothetical protein